MWQQQQTTINPHYQNINQQDILSVRFYKDDNDHQGTWKDTILDQSFYFFSIFYLSRWRQWRLLPVFFFFVRRRKHAYTISVSPEFLHRRSGRPYVPQGTRSKEKKAKQRRGIVKQKTKIKCILRQGTNFPPKKKKRGKTEQTNKKISTNYQNFPMGCVPNMFAHRQKKQKQNK